jgi:pimeloyl-ACP methyl ester carboxylesterase
MGLVACTGAGDSVSSQPALTSTTTSSAPAEGIVTFVTSDGVTLEARRFGSGDRWVVLAHMRRASMESWFTFGDELAAAGYTALAFNHRGYGGSAGSGFAVDIDTTAAVDHALASGAASVSVIGASMGGTGAIAAAAVRDVDAVVTLSAPAAFEGVDATSAMASVTARTLLVAATGDQPYADAVAEFAAASSAPVNTLFLEGSAHGTDLLAEHGTEVTDQILAHLASAG